MPSSSTRTTHFEQTSIEIYRAVYTHLWYSKHPTIADFFSPSFATLLDMDAATLRSTLAPAYSELPAQERVAVIAITQEMDRLAGESIRKKQSERLMAAGRGCSDVGDLLGQVGRAQEGVQWACWADELWGMAREAERHEAQKVEEAKQRARGTEVIVLD